MIYLCIPAHNEEQTVGVVLWKIRQVLTEFPRDYQILVADDASTDRTADVLAPYARVLPLTLLRTRERRGYAASLEMLLREAVRRSPYPKRDMIVTLQADFTDEPEDIVPLLKKVEQGADIVGGTRATDRRPKFLERWLLRWQTSMLRRGGWPESAGEPLAGFRAYRVSVVARALEEAGSNRLLTWDGVVADAELLRACAPHARRIESVDLVHRPDRRQRPSRSTTWERTKLLRRFVRGVRPIGTVPLADLAPETLPPPRPVEVERARRSEAAAEAAPQRRRNGRGTRPATGRGPGGSGERAGSARQEGRRRPESSGESRQRSRGAATSGEGRKRAQPGVAGEAAAPAQRRRRGAPAAAEATGGEPVAPETVAPGREATDAEGAAAPAKKKRRRRRRKPASQRGAQAAAGSEAGVEGATLAEAPSQAPLEGGTDAVSEGITNGSADDGGTGTPQKKRRRGGRRGGRGRRRKPAGGAAEAGEGAAEAAPAMAEDGNPAGAGGRPTAEAAHAAAGEPNGND